MTKKPKTHKERRYSIGEERWIEVEVDDYPLMMRLRHFINGKWTPTTTWVDVKVIDGVGYEDQYGNRYKFGELDFGASDRSGECY